MSSVQGQHPSHEIIGKLWRAGYSPVQSYWVVHHWRSFRYEPSRPWCPLPGIRLIILSKPAYEYLIYMIIIRSSWTKQINVFLPSGQTKTHSLSWLRSPDSPAGDGLPNIGRPLTQQESELSILILQKSTTWILRYMTAIGRRKKMMQHWIQVKVLQVDEVCYWKTVHPHGDEFGGLEIRRVLPLNMWRSWLLMSNKWVCLLRVIRLETW